MEKTIKSLEKTHTKLFKVLFLKNNAKLKQTCKRKGTPTRSGRASFARARARVLAFMSTYF